MNFDKILSFFIYFIKSFVLGCILVVTFGIIYGVTDLSVLMKLHTIVSSIGTMIQYYVYNSTLTISFDEDEEPTE